MQGKDVHWGLPLHAELWGGGKFRKWLAIVTRTLWKGRMCIEDYHCMQSFGGGGSLENDLQSWQELCDKKDVCERLWGGGMCIEELPLRTMHELWGGKFRKWLAIVTRTLWKGRMCIEDYHCMQSFGGGSLENDLQWWQELWWKGRMCIEDYHCMQSFGGGSLENDLQSWQELCEREGCALRTTIACRALGGEV